MSEPSSRGTRRAQARASALYVGRVFHERLTPRRHAFRTRLYLTYLDLDELPGLFHGRWLWSGTRRALSWFRRADYLGAGTEDEQRPLDEVVRDRVEAELGRRPAGPVRVLTQLRTFGYLFNPVSFYYCFAPGDGEGDGAGALEAVVAEITNTPWSERHTYVLDGRARDAAGRVADTFAKAFHVSPFFGMDQVYRWSFYVPRHAPGEVLEIGMTNLELGEPVFHAGVALERRELSGAALASALCTSPLQTLRAHFAIYLHAALLWCKRTPFHPHPALSEGPHEVPCGDTSSEPSRPIS